MKKTIFTALMAVAFTALVSCDQSAKPKNANPLIGQWKIDSIATTTNDFGALLLAMSLKDSSAYDMSFTEDSVLLQQKDTVTKSAYTFNASQEQLFINEDSTVFTYHLIEPNYIKLTDKDSSTLFLRKQQ